MGTYLIVGGSSGIGAALKSQLIGEGNIVYSLGRRKIENDPRHFAMNVLKDPFPAIAETIDGLVYCPGSINLRSFRSLKIEDFKKDWEINIGGAILVLQTYFGNLQQASNPAVVLFSSVAAKIGMPYHSSVAAAKGALEGLVRSLAAEWAPRIRVNAIAPSLTDTPLAGHLLDVESRIKAAEERHPLCRIGKSSDMASLALFLLSDKAAFITGQVIHADGGISAVRI
jgi:NAD(P)-dependent dehydrogenase (short-subunit alcohol dehydrogenase family)